MREIEKQTETGKQISRDRKHTKRQKKTETEMPERGKEKQRHLEAEEEPLQPRHSRLALSLPRVTKLGPQVWRALPGQRQTQGAQESPVIADL